MKKSILIIGGAGQLGSRLCAEVAARGWQPVTFDDLSTGLGDRVKHGPLVKVDARETPRIVRTLMEYKISDIVHCALLKDDGAVEPALIYDQHLKTVMSCLQALKESRGRRLTVVNASPRTQGMITQILDDCRTADKIDTRLISATSTDEIAKTILSTLD